MQKGVHEHPTVPDVGFGVIQTPLTAGEVLAVSGQAAGDQGLVTTVADRTGQRRGLTGCAPEVPLSRARRREASLSKGVASRTCHQRSDRPALARARSSRERAPRRHREGSRAARRARGAAVVGRDTVDQAQRKRSAAQRSRTCRQASSDGVEVISCRPVTTMRRKTSPLTWTPRSKRRASESATVDLPAAEMPVIKTSGCSSSSVTSADYEAA